MYNNFYDSEPSAIPTTGAETPCSISFHFKPSTVVYNIYYGHWKTILNETTSLWAHVLQMLGLRSQSTQPASHPIVYDIYYGTYDVDFPDFTSIIAYALKKLESRFKYLQIAGPAVATNIYRGNTTVCHNFYNSAPPAAIFAGNNVKPPLNVLSVWQSASEI